MRWLAFVFMLGCAHASPSRELPVVVVRASATSHVSFRERTGPKHPVKDVTHVEVSVRRVEGPESIVLGFAAIDRLATECWRDRETLVLFPTDHDDAVTLTIDTRADGSMSDVEIDPPTTPKPIAMCLVHAMAAQPLHAEPGPQHMVLAIAARVWWTS